MTHPTNKGLTSNQNSLLDWLLGILRQPKGHPRSIQIDYVLPWEQQVANEYLSTREAEKNHFQLCWLVVQISEDQEWFFNSQGRCSLLIRKLLGSYKDANYSFFQHLSSGNPPLQTHWQGQFFLFFRFYLAKLFAWWNKYLATPATFNVICLPLFVADQSPNVCGSHLGKQKWLQNLERKRR